MDKLNSLRKIIREEVRAVFQEELAGILKEAILSNKGSQLTEMVKPSKPKIPGTLNSSSFKPVVAPNLGIGNPLNNLLAETAQTMSADEMAHFGGQTVERDIPTVDSVNDMFAAARPSSNLDAIQINAVPDFSGIMAKMKANGEI